MEGFDKAVGSAADVAEMHEMNTLAEMPDHIRNLVRPAYQSEIRLTEGDAVRLIVNYTEGPIERLEFAKDAGDSQYGREWRIVGMKSQPDVRLLGHRNDALEKVAKSLPKLRLCDTEAVRFGRTLHD